MLSAGCALENVFVPVAPSWCWNRVACFGVFWPPAENCLFEQLRTRLQLNHKIRRKPLSWVAGSWFPPLPLQAFEWGHIGRGVSGSDSSGCSLAQERSWLSFVLLMRRGMGVSGRDPSSLIRDPMAAGVPWGGGGASCAVGMRHSVCWAIFCSIRDVCLR